MRLWLDYAWIILGLCLDYAWIMLGLCLDYAWIMLGLFSDYACIKLGILFSQARLVDKCGKAAQLAPANQRRSHMAY